MKNRLITAWLFVSCIFGTAVAAYSGSFAVGFIAWCAPVAMMIVVLVLIEFEKYAQGG